MALFSQFVDMSWFWCISLEVTISNHLFWLYIPNLRRFQKLDIYITKHSKFWLIYLISLYKMICVFLQSLRNITPSNTKESSLYILEVKIINLVGMIYIIIDNHYINNHLSIIYIMIPKTVSSRWYTEGPLKHTEGPFKHRRIGYQLASQFRGFINITIYKKLSKQKCSWMSYLIHWFLKCLRGQKRREPIKI